MKWYISKGLGPLGPIEPSAKDRALRILAQPSPPRSARRTCLPGMEAFLLTSPLPARGVRNRQASSDKAPFSEDRGPDMELTSCLPPSQPHGLRVFPWQTGSTGLGGLPSIFKPVGQRESLGVRRTRGVEKGGAEWPPSFSPDHGGDASPLKTLASNQTPAQWCRSRSLSRCLSCSRVLSGK